MYICTVAIVLFMAYYFNHFLSGNQLSFSLTGYTTVKQTNPYLNMNLESDFTNETLIEQELPPVPDGIDAIQIMFYAKGKHRDGEVLLQLKNARTHKVCTKRTVPYDQIKNREYVDLPVGELSPEDREGPLTLCITAQGGVKTHISVYTSAGDGIRGCKFLVSSREQDEDLFLNYARKGLSNFAKSLLLLAGLIIFCILYHVFLRGRTSGRVQTAACFIVLYLMYIFRAPGDSFANYLWAEDGGVLLSSAMRDGLRSVLIPGNGAYWVLPRLIGIVCYGISLPFRSITNLAVLQGLVTKLAGAASIGWFMSDRFQWVVKERFHRFLICAGIIFMMPAAMDVFTCDTSIQFLLNFAVFLVGLDLLAGEKVSTPTWGETCFLVIQTLSNAAAPFGAAVAACAFLRWFADGYRKKTLKTGTVIIETGKVGVITAGTLLQVQLILSGSRVSGSLQFVDRIIACLKLFPFFPYFQSMNDWKILLLCLVCWAAILLLAKLQIRMTVYCVLYSWLFLCFCSMTAAVQSLPALFKITLSDKQSARYMLLSSMVMIFLLLAALYRIRDRKAQLVTSAAVFCAVFSAAAQAYQVRIWGEEFIIAYDQNVGSYDVHGTDWLSIPTGPAPIWHLEIPVSVSKADAGEEAEGEIYNISVNETGNVVTGMPAGSMVLVSGSLSDEDGGPLKRIFLKTGENSYLAATLRKEGDRILEVDQSEALYAGSGEESVSTEQVLEGSMALNEKEVSFERKGTEFILHLPVSYFAGGAAELEFYGEKADGTFCRKVFEVDTSFLQ